MKGAMHIAPIIDTGFQILWDGKLVGKGSYRKDFSYRFIAHRGNHRLSLNGHAIVQSDLEIEIPYGEKSFIIDLDYNVYYLRSEYRFFIRQQ